MKYDRKHIVNVNRSGIFSCGEHKQISKMLELLSSYATVASFAVCVAIALSYLTAVGVKYVLK